MSTHTRITFSGEYTWKVLETTDSPQHLVLNMLSEEDNTCSVSDAVGGADSQSAYV